MGVIVGGEGPARASIMLVGQNPGAEEARQGRPFVGRAGRYLDEVLAKNGIRRDEVYITNTVKETTPRNRKPTREEVSRWAAELEREVERVRPQVVVLMGSVARSAPRRRDVRYIEAPHPAATMRFPRMRTEFERVFSDLARESKNR